MTLDRRPIAQRLMPHFETPDGADLWLMTPHPDLDFVTPRRAVDRGDAEAVHQLIDLLDIEAGR